MWPYMIVAVVRNPTPCAVSMTCNHWSVESLSAHRSCLTSSSKISAAVPGSVPSPASFNRVRNACSETPRVSAPCQISSGENACTWRAGATDFTARQMSRYVSPE